MNTQTTGLTYTYLEVQELLQSLSEADIARLIQIYRSLGCEARSGLDAHDVLSKVVCKVLAMKRAWPREVSVLNYLVETGRSVISNEEKKYDREVTTDPTLIDGCEVDQYSGEHWTKASPSPESEAVKQQSGIKLMAWIQQIQQLFEDDLDATCFITQKLAELKKAAILLACKFTDQAYRNAEKRIKDKLRKKFPKGFPWWEIN